MNNRLDFLVPSNQESESQWKKAVEIALHQSFFHAVIQAPSFNQCVVIRHQQYLEYLNPMEVVTIKVKHQKEEDIHQHSLHCQVVTIKVKHQKEEEIHQHSLHCQYLGDPPATYPARPEGPLYLLEIPLHPDAQINGEV